MSWRTVVISKRAKLDMKTGYLVVRSEEETYRINLDEISVLIIENTAVSITGCLISALTDKKIKVIFCNEKRDPACELVSLYGSHDTSAKLRKQIKWDDNVKTYIWSEIIAEKIPTYRMKREEVKTIIFRYIFGYYNTQRINSFNEGGLPPVALRISKQLAPHAA